MVEKTIVEKAAEKVGSRPRDGGRDSVAGSVKTGGWGGCDRCDKRTDTRQKGGKESSG